MSYRPLPPAAPPRFVDLDLPAAGGPGARGRLRIEIQWLRPQRTDRPLLVFLHEGLGSVTMWRGFPARLCEAADLRGLVYSRPGYGRSTARVAVERWPTDYMQQQADGVLPALLAALQVDAPVWLLGHSDGGTIALIRAATAPASVAGLIVIAPHLMVEDCSLASIRAARQAWQQTDLRERLARYHDDPASAFFGWNDVWLSDAFRTWSIEQQIGAIRCPTLAIQGEQDEYGTLAQIDGILARVPGAEKLLLPQSGHAPHRDAPDAVIAAISRWITERLAERLAGRPADRLADRPGARG